MDKRISKCSEEIQDLNHDLRILSDERNGHKDSSFAVSFLIQLMTRSRNFSIFRLNKKMWSFREQVFTRLLNQYRNENPSVVHDLFFLASPTENILVYDLPISLNKKSGNHTLDDLNIILRASSKKGKAHTTLIQVKMTFYNKSISDLYNYNQSISFHILDTQRIKLELDVLDPYIEEEADRKFISLFLNRNLLSEFIKEINEKEFYNLREQVDFLSEYNQKFLKGEGSRESKEKLYKKVSEISSWALVHSIKCPNLIEKIVKFFPKIEQLVLQSQDLSGANLSKLKILPLKILCLRECALVKIPVNVEDINSLTQLDLEGNNISSLSGSFKNLSSLIFLNISRNPIKISNEVEKLPSSLETLNISENQIDDAGLQALAQNVCLKKIQINSGTKSYLRPFPIHIDEI